MHVEDGLTEGISAVRFFRILSILFSAALVTPVWAASTIDSLPAITFPLPDPGTASSSTRNLWATGANCDGAGAADCRVTYTQMGYILQSASAPTSPYRYQYWWDTSAGTTATLKVYSGTQWVSIGTFDFTNNTWTPTPPGGGIGTIASAATTDLGTLDQTVIDVTGSATINSLGSTAQVGTVKVLIFAATPTFTYNSSTLKIPGAANLTVAANDIASFVALGGGAWQLISYQPIGSLYATLASPAFTGTPTTPTPSAGNNSTMIANTAWIDLYFAPLASPAFTGTPTAPTPSPGDNSTKLATTGFITGNFAPIDSPAFTGTPTAPTAASGTSNTQIATTAFAKTMDSPAFTGTPTVPTPGANVSSTEVPTTAWVQSYFQNPPGGRLTLATHTPVMTTSQSAKATIYYDSYVGNTVPVYNGTSDVSLPIGSNQISDALQSGGSGLVSSGGVFDMWAINVSGTLTICHATDGSGGGWAADTGGSATARGTGYTQLDNSTRGYITNANSITHCYNGTTDEGAITANHATYLGTFYATANGQTSFTLGSSAAGGGAGTIGIWNYYNRITLNSQVVDANANWTYGTVAVRAADNSATFRNTFVIGVPEDSIRCHYQDSFQTAAVLNSGADISVGLDSATVPSSFQAQENSAAAATTLYAAAEASFIGLSGLHYCQAQESATTANNVTFVGTGAGNAVAILTTGLRY